MGRLPWAQIVVLYAPYLFGTGAVIVGLAGGFILPVKIALVAIGAPLMIGSFVAHVSVTWPSRKPPFAPGDDRLNRLMDYYRSGVAIRSDGLSLQDPQRVSEWIRVAQIWRNGVVETVREWSRVEALFLEVLNLMPALRFPDAIHSEHRRYLRMMSERLNRLNGVIRRSDPDWNHGPDARH